MATRLAMLLALLSACDRSGEAGPDADGDGFSIADGDCDDGDVAVHPDAREVCDAADVDEDCDGAADDADPDGAGGQVAHYVDADGDGFGDCDDEGILACDPPADTVVEAGDCNDADVAVHPGASEVCNGVDDDCDDAIPADETDDTDGDGAVTCVDCAPDNAAIYPGAPELCDGIASGCPIGVVPADELDADGDGFVACLDWIGDATLQGGDCDDANDQASPGAPGEIACDGVDSDCSGAEILVPATFATVQDAVNAAVAGDEVCISAGTYVENVVVAVPITLTGVDGAELTILDGGGVDTVLVLDDAGAVTVSGLTLTNGDGINGGGIRALSDTAAVSLTVEASILTGNDAVDGGGIYGYGADVVLVDTLVSDNAASLNGGGLHVERCNCVGGPLTGLVETFGGEISGNDADNGGGIYTFGADVLIDGTLIDGNDASIYGGGICADQVASYVGAPVAATGATITNNRAMFGGGVLAYGALALELTLVSGNTALDSGGGAIVVGSVEITDSDFTDNAALSYLGGGLAVVDYGYLYYGGAPGTATITGSTFERNTTPSWGAGGGAYLNDLGGAVTDCTFTENVSGDGGGLYMEGVSDAVAEIVRPIFAGNLGSADGGGMFVRDVTVVDPTFTLNVAGGAGGGARVDYGTVTWTGGTLLSNAAEEGGGISWSGAGGSLSGAHIEANSAVSGGGLHVRLDDPLTITSVDILSNLATDQGGGVFQEDTGLVTFVNARIVDNEAVTGGGGVVTAAVLANSVVAGNRATLDFGGLATYNTVDMIGYGDTAGGGIILIDPELVLDQTTVVGNTAGRYGGGVYGATGIYGAIVAFNAAGQAGGGVVPRVGQQTWSDVFGNTPDDYLDASDPVGLSGNVAVDPLFAFYDPSVDALTWDLHLLLGSPVVDAGNPAVIDPDGSVADIGAYGGPLGAW